MGAEELPQGISLRGRILWVRFTYPKGRTRRESTGITYNRASDLTYVVNLLNDVKETIKDPHKKFIYADWFPNSPALKEFEPDWSDKTSEDYLDEYLNLCENKGLEHSTIEGYRRAINPMRDYFKAIPAGELNASHIKKYIETHSHLKMKTISNRISILNCAFDELVIDQIMTSNPARAIKAATYYQGRALEKAELEGQETDIEEDVDNVDPFEPAEIEAILKQAERWPPYARMIEFNFNHGLRLSELAGLQWSHISIPARKMRIRNARVLDKNKDTKTTSSRRDLILSDRDIELLEAQRAYSGNKSLFVWINQKHMPIKQTRFSRGFWALSLEKAKVRWRPASQMRHTFATKHISEGMNVFQLAPLMGHTSPKMLFEHYGSFIEAYQKEQEDKEALLQQQQEKRANFKVIK